MARTSWVREFRAMTVGSLSTMPRPREYTSVLAVPRSMARSLARLLLHVPRRGHRPVARRLSRLGGREGPKLPAERLDPGFHRLRSPVAQHDQGADQGGGDDGADEIEKIGENHGPDHER